ATSRQIPSAHAARWRGVFDREAIISRRIVGQDPCYSSANSLTDEMNAGRLACIFHTPVAASRQSAALFSSDKCGALTRRRYRVLTVHAGCEISSLDPGRVAEALFSAKPLTSSRRSVTISISAETNSIWIAIKLKITIMIMIMRGFQLTLSRLTTRFAGLHSPE